MPRVGIVQSKNFIDLLRELGISKQDIPFSLQSEVVPVALVTSGVAFSAAPTPPYAVTDIFTAGVVTNPLVGDILADTGQLPVGSYSVQVVMYGDVAMLWDVQWRNAANSANLASQRFRQDTSEQGLVVFSTRYQIENANERFRVIAQAIGGVGNDFQGSIYAKI